MKVLDLFSGIGGFSLGLERAGMETVAFCEYDEKCRKVLAKHWPDVPQYTDVRTLTGEQLERDGITDIGLICGGYPCQPFSLAGVRQGQADDRHLWPEVRRLIGEIRPDWVLCENVYGHVSMGLDDVLADLETLGYTWWAGVIPACAVDAKHRRDRIWVVGGSEVVADSQELQRDGGGEHWEQDGGQVPQPRERGSAEFVADPTRGGQQGPGQPINAINSEAATNRQGAKFVDGSKSGVWLPEPNVGRVAHGVPGRVDRLKQLGNAVVPQVVQALGEMILESE